MSAMIKRALTGLAAALLAALALDACGSSSDAGPFGNNTTPSGQCVPARPGQVISYGLSYVQNPTHHTATILHVFLRNNHGIRRVRAWAVPTMQLYGVGLGPPPPQFKVVGFQWNRRQPAQGAQVVPTHGKDDRLNLVMLITLAPGRTRGRAAGVNITYRLNGNTYLIPDRTFVVLAAKC
jgi:hypothetical protein